MAITKATASSIAPAAKGDLVAGSATNDAAVLGVGANDTVLTADSSTATGLKWAAAGASGLTLIVSTAFSNVANATFDSVFTTTYRSYLVVFDELYASVEGNDVYFQLRYSTSTQATGYYGSTIQGKFDGGTVTQSGTNDQSSLRLVANIGDSSIKNGGFFMLRGADGSNSAIPTLNGQWSTVGYQAHFGGGVDPARAYSGFVITSDANITGRISVYGLAK
jgi:hypothetical protein